MLTTIATFFAAIPTKAKIMAALIALLLFACFMAYRAAYNDGAGDYKAKVEKASNEAAMDAVNGERRANANSDARRDENDAKDAIIRKEIENAKANGSDPVAAYFDGLRKANSGREDKPAK